MTAVGRSQYFWVIPLIVILSSLLVITFTFLVPSQPVRGWLLLWFVIMCPGLSIVPLFRLGNFLIEMGLAMALGISIDGLVVVLHLYAKLWSPPAMLWVLISLSLLGSFLQLVYPTQILRILRR
jgi:hypothetical protein